MHRREMSCRLSETTSAKLLPPLPPGPLVAEKVRRDTTLAVDLAKGINFPGVFPDLVLRRLHG